MRNVEGLSKRESLIFSLFKKPSGPLTLKLIKSEIEKSENKTVSLSSVNVSVKYLAAKLPRFGLRIERVSSIGRGHGASYQMFNNKFE